jgi:hypothetical protein
MENAWHVRHMQPGFSRACAPRGLFFGKTQNHEAVLVRARDCILALSRKAFCPVCRAKDTSGKPGFLSLRRAQRKEMRPTS